MSKKLKYNFEPCIPPVKPKKRKPKYQRGAYDRPATAYVCPVSKTVILSAAAFQVLRCGALDIAADTKLRMLLLKPGAAYKLRVEKNGDCVQPRGRIRCRHLIKDFDIQPGTRPVISYNGGILIPMDGTPKV